MITVLAALLLGQVVLKDEGTTLGPIYDVNCSGAGITQPVVICRQYGSAQGGGQAIVVPSGVTNGVSVLVSAGGAGSLAVGSIRMTFIAE